MEKNAKAAEVAAEKGRSKELHRMAKTITGEWKREVEGVKDKQGSSCQEEISGTSSEIPKSFKNPLSLLLKFIRTHQNSSQPVDFEGDFLEFLMMSQKSLLDNYSRGAEDRSSVKAVDMG